MRRHGGRHPRINNTSYGEAPGILKFKCYSGGTRNDTILAMSERSGFIDGGAIRFLQEAGYRQYSTGRTRSCYIRMHLV